MSTEALRGADPYPLETRPAGAHAPPTVTGHGAGGPAPKRIVVGYGFWIFLLSDVIMFSSFFAAYAVLFKNTAGGPAAQQLFDLHNTAVETACLLASTFTCGMASLAVGQRNQKWTQIVLLATGLLGLAFITLEVREFVSLVHRGAGPSRSAFLSSFFTSGRMPRRARDRGPAVARHHDGAVLCERVPPGYPPPVPVLQPVLACP